MPNTSENTGPDPLKSTTCRRLSPATQSRVVTARARRGRRERGGKGGRGGQKLGSFSWFRKCWLSQRHASEWVPPLTKQLKPPRRTPGRMAGAWLAQADRLVSGILATLVAPNDISRQEAPMATSV